MIVLRFFTLLLLLGTGIGPGLWLVRKLRWSAPERLVAAIAASGIVLYLAAGLIYLLRLPPISEFAVSAACLGFLVAARVQARLLLACREIRWVLGAFAFLLIWAFLLLAMVRSYSGGSWAGDWIEHYQRTLFFLQHQPAATQFIGLYILPARPPFMNLLAAHFLAQVGERYDLFQAAFTVLNLLAFFPCWLIARLLVSRAGGRAGRIALLGLFFASPLFLQNATYAWTKGLANFYVIAGLWFYVRGWRKSDPLRLGAYALALTAGILVHYSAVPYAGLLLLHALCFELPRCAREVRRKALAAALPGAALLGTWLAWSIAAYGPAATFGSNTTAQSAGAMSPIENARKIALNLYYSIVPHPLRIGCDAFHRLFFQPNGWGLLRDYYFTMAQTTLVAGMGCLGGLVVLFLLWRTVRTPGADRPGGRRFWLGFAVLGAILTVATHPTVELLGVAHVCSQPLLLLGLTFLAASFSELPGVLRAAVVLGCAVDFFAGILVHFSLEHEVGAIRPVAGRLVLRLTTDLLNPQAVSNLNAKLRLGYVLWGDHFAGAFIGLQLLVLVLFGTVFFGLVRAALNPRAPGSRARPLAWIGLALPLTLGAISIAGIDQAAGEIVPDPPALAACLQAAQQNFDSGGARFNLGLALYRDGHANEAVEQWTEALLLQPDRAPARYFAQIAGFVHGIPVSADLAAAEAVQEFPDAAEARYDVAGALWERKHAAPAISELEEALRLQPDFPKARAALREITAPAP